MSLYLHLCSLFSTYIQDIFQVSAHVMGFFSDFFFCCCSSAEPHCSFPVLCWWLVILNPILDASY